MRSPGMRHLLFALAALVIVALALGGALILGSGPEATPTPRASPTASPTPSPTASPMPTATPSPTPSPTPEPAAACPLNGLELSDPTVADRVPMIVQIENNPIARPPSGLNLADLVIEAPVEGDTTRFMAVFMCNESIGAAVGPVRSARYFNIDLYQQLHGVTFHYGGAGKVLSRLDRNEVPRVNGLTDPWPFFFRAGPWAAPHNVYLDVDAARAELEGGALRDLAAGIEDPGRGPIDFDLAAELPEGRAVGSIGLQTASFWRFGWDWDAGSGQWLRSDGGVANSDRLTGERIGVRTVLVQVVRQDVLPGELDPGGYPRRYQHLVGEGDGRLYIDGTGYDVRWTRSHATDVTAWTYADSGEPVVVPPGRVWWEIVPEGSAISEG